MAVACSRLSGCLDRISACDVQAMLARVTIIRSELSLPLQPVMSEVFASIATVMRLNARV